MKTTLLFTLVVLCLTILTSAAPSMLSARQAKRHSDWRIQELDRKHAEYNWWKNALLNNGLGMPEKRQYSAYGELNHDALEAPLIANGRLMRPLYLDDRLQRDFGQEVRLSDAVPTEK